MSETAIGRSAWGSCRRKSKLALWIWIRTTRLSSSSLPPTSATATTTRRTRSWETPSACASCRWVWLQTSGSPEGVWERGPRSRYVWLLWAFVFRHTGFWSRHSQSLSEDYWDCRGRWYCGVTAEDHELSQAALHYDHGESTTCPISHTCQSVSQSGDLGSLWFVFFQDVHSRYRTEAHQDVVGRFNERWVLLWLSWHLEHF